MLNLISLWSNTIELNPATKSLLQNYPSDTKQAAINFDRDTIQSSFEFKEPPHVVFVESTRTLKPTDFYDDLPEISMSLEENAARLKVVEEQVAKNPRFYDGNQMLIADIVYDDSTNTIYVEAKKVPYSFIVTLSNKKFPDVSVLYQLRLFKTGVLAPLITRNGMSMLLQRAALGLYSVPGGFLETHGEEKRLNFYDGRNLVIETAESELKEEIVGIKGTNKLRFEFSKPQITSVSFRKTGINPIGTIEFVAPTRVNCDSSKLRDVFLTNWAKDAYEHTLKHEVIPLDSQARDELLSKLLTGCLRMPGSSLYLPVALSLTRLANQNSCMMDLPRAIPNSSSVAWPLGIFKASPTRSLSLRDKEDDSERYREGFNLIS